MAAGKATEPESGLSFPLVSLGKRQRKQGRRRQDPVTGVPEMRIATPVLRHWFAMTDLGEVRGFPGAVHIEAHAFVPNAGTSGTPSPTVAKADFTCRGEHCSPAGSDSTSSIMFR